MAEDLNLDGLDDSVVRRAEAIADAMIEAKNATKDLNKQFQQNGEALVDYGGIFNSITRGARKVADIQREAQKSSKGLVQATVQLEKQQDSVRRLNEKINTLYEAAETKTGETRDRLLQQAKNLANARANAKSLAEEYTKVAETAAGLDGRTKFFGAMSDFVGDIPGLRKLSGPFKDAESAAKKLLIDSKGTAGSMKLLSAGGKAFGKSIGAAAKAFLPLLIIQTIYKVLKFIVDLFVSAQKNTVALAKNLGISRAQADLLRKEFVEIGIESGKLYVTSEKLIKAQSELVELLDRGGRFTKTTLLAQTFLTERLNMSAEAAAKLTSKFEAFGGNADQGIDNIIELNNRLTKTGDSTSTIGQLMNSVSKASGQIAASFGFSNIEIAKGVLQVRKFGLNLMQAQNIANGLLDFESSISNELEAELLTGKNLNLEKARMMALTGDIAGATEQVMSQMKGLTAEQRKSPIIMKSLAATIGLSVDELQDAYLLETDRTSQMEQQLKAQDEFKRRAAIIYANTKLDIKQREELIEKERLRLGLSEANRTELENTVTVQQAYEEALAKAKDTLSRFVSSGDLDKLVDTIMSLTERIASAAGIDLVGEKQKQQMKDNAEKISNKDLSAAGISRAVYKTFSERASLSKGMFGITSDFALATNSGIDEARKELEKLNSRIAKAKENSQYGELNFDKLQTNTNSKNTNNGGTDEVVKELQKNNKILSDLVNKSGDVIMDGNKVGYSLALASNKSN